jgi:hypothetical protein
MTITLAVSVLVCILGLLLYLFAAPPKAQRVGELMFSCGLLAALLLFRGALHLSSG